VAVVLLLAVGGLYGALVGQLKSATDEDESFVALERHGVAYLRPLTRLVGELTAAQSAAVRGAAVETAIRLDRKAAMAIAPDLRRRLHSPDACERIAAAWAR